LWKAAARRRTKDANPQRLGHYIRFEADVRPLDFR
jgi:hypothetical protein